jgi:hypothetical protein
MSRPKKFTSIRVTIETATELRKYEGELQAQTGQFVTDDEAIAKAIKGTKLSEFIASRVFGLVSVLEAGDVEASARQLISFRDELLAKCKEAKQ